MARTIRVDTVPRGLRHAHEAYSQASARLARAGLRRWRRQVDWHIEGNTAALAPDANVVLTIWHEALVLYFMRFGDEHMKNHVWMNHPAWFMRPVHLMLEAMDITYVLGSTGHGGRAAADEVADALKGGASTTVAVDGPAGPYRQMRSGCFHLAAQAGVPIVPLRIEVDRFFRAATWDKKIVPLPGARVVVRPGEPMVIDDPSAPGLKEELARRLG